MCFREVAYYLLTLVGAYTLNYCYYNLCILTINRKYISLWLKTRSQLFTNKNLTINMWSRRGSHGPLIKSWPFITFGRMNHIMACLRLKFHVCFASAGTFSAWEWLSAIRCARPKLILTTDTDERWFSGACKCGWAGKSTLDLFASNSKLRTSTSRIDKIRNSKRLAGLAV